MNKSRFLPRILALFLSLVLALPGPAFALRPTQLTEAGTEERELAAALSVTRSGTEEQDLTGIVEELRSLRRDYRNYEVRELSKKLSELVFKLVRHAEQKARKDLETWVAVRSWFADGTFEAVVYDPSDPKSARKLKEVREEDKVQYTGQAVFVAVGGSVGREDITLNPNETGIGSDLDFFVMPVDEASVPYSQALQHRMQDILEREISKHALGFEIDRHLLGQYNYHLPPGEVPRNLLGEMPGPGEAAGLSGPVIKVMKNVGGTRQEVPLPAFLTAATFRDFRFLSGDEGGFKSLREALRPYLYPYGANGEVHRVGDALVKDLIVRAKVMQSDLQKSYDKGIGINVKEVLRLVQYLVWISRAVGGVETSNVLDALEQLSEQGTLDPEDAGKLRAAYGFFLRLRIALLMEEGRYAPSTSEEKKRQQILSENLLPRIAPHMTPAGDVALLKADFETHLWNIFSLAREPEDLFPKRFAAGTEGDTSGAEMDADPRWIEGATVLSTPTEAPVKVRLEIAPHAFQNGLKRSAAEKLLAMVSRQNLAGTKEDGRSLYLPLGGAEILRVNGRPFRLVKAKSVTYRGGPPIMEPYSDADSSIQQPGGRLGYDVATGTIRAEPAIVHPKGGGYIEEAVNEYRTMLEALEKGVPTGYPFAIGEFPDMSFNGRKIGFLLIALEEGEDVRYGASVRQRLEWGARQGPSRIKEIYSQEFGRLNEASEAAAKTLRKLHEAGIVHSHPGPHNFQILKDGRAAIYDFTNAKLAREMTKGEFVLRVFNDFRSLSFSTLSIAGQGLDLNRYRSVLKTLGLKESPNRRLADGYFTPEDIRRIDKGRIMNAIAEENFIGQFLRTAWPPRLLEGKRMADLNHDSVRIFEQIAATMHDRVVPQKPPIAAGVEEGEKSLQDIAALLKAFNAIGLAPSQALQISGWSILGELPGETSQLGGLVTKTARGHKILFPRDRLAEAIRNEIYLADLLREVVELDLADRGVLLEQARTQALDARASFLAKGPRDTEGLIQRVPGNAAYETYLIRGDLYSLVNHTVAIAFMPPDSQIDPEGARHRFSKLLSLGEIFLQLPGAARLIQLYEKGNVILLQAPKIGALTILPGEAYPFLSWEGTQDTLKFILWEERIHLASARLGVSFWKETADLLSSSTHPLVSRIRAEVVKGYTKLLGGELTPPDIAAEVLPRLLFAQGKPEEFEASLNEIFPEHLRETMRRLRAETVPSEDEVAEVRLSAQRFRATPGSEDHRTRVERVLRQVGLNPGDAAGAGQVRWLGEGIGIRTVGGKEELVIAKSVLESAQPEQAGVKIIAQESVSVDALMLFNPPGQTVGFLPEEPAGVHREVERAMQREGAEFIVALDASIPAQRMSEYLPQQHPFTVLLESGKWDQYRGIARAILRVPAVELRNRIIQFIQGSARAVMIGDQEFVALDISA